MKEIPMEEVLQPFQEKKQTLDNLDYSKRHAKGLLSAMERVELLMDKGTFVEIAPLARECKTARETKPGGTPRDNIVVGYGQVNGRMVGVAAYDMQFRGGSMGKTAEWKFTRLKRFLLEQGFPLVILNEGTGARLEEEVASDGAYDNPQFSDFVALSGYVPIVTAIMGLCIGGHANLSAVADFVPMTEKGAMMIAGPQLLKTKMGIDTTVEDLGGVDKHVKKSGMADLRVKDDAECIEKIKEFLSYLPNNCHEDPPVWPTQDPSDRRIEDIDEIVPTDHNFAYDMLELIEAIVDDGKYFEMQPEYAPNIITCMAHLNGRAVGIIANQPEWMAGTVDTKACMKISRFINFCDAFGLALIFMHDVPGFYPSPQSEEAGIIRWSTRLIYEIEHATVPRLAVMVRKSYGLAHYGMNSLGMKPNLIVAWPTATFSAISPDDAVNVLFGKSLSDDEAGQQRREELIAEFKSKTGILGSAEAGFVDDVIDPSETRKVLINALQMAKKRRNHLGFKRRGITPI
ncbi:MAG TPA: acyl-CoA carboxylase subunit beta [Gammaproteobacteria bacterium]|nr:acyl-CoA carboxylase subunit beta [Gammaproteobacteria bacterium]HCO60825.1 acyl-CoA carboxylase subunit beta [Porticoccaceae bacterium]